MGLSAALQDNDEAAIEAVETGEEYLRKKFEKALENGELNPMIAMMQGKVKLRGSIPFATKFMSLFGYGG